MTTKIVGLDLGLHTVKACELVTTFRNFELVGFSTEPVEAQEDERPDFSELAQAAKRLLERRGLLGETLFCALPAHTYSTVVLEFPFDQPKKIESVLPFQLEELMPFSEDEVVWDYQIIERREDGTVSVLVAYVLRTVFESFLEAMATEGLDPKVCGIGPLAWLNLYETYNTQEGPVALLDIGHSHTELCIVGQNLPVTVRDIEGGGKEITEALAQTFNVPIFQAERGKLTEGFIAPTAEQPTATEGDAARRQWINLACHQALEPVLREVNRTLASYESHHKTSISRILVTGGTAAMRGLLQTLEAQLGTPCELFDPSRFPQNRLPASTLADQTRIGKPLALSLRAFPRETQSHINFRKGPYVYTGDFGFFKGRLIFLGVAIAAIIALAITNAVTHKRVLEAEYDNIIAQARAISKPILGFESEDLDLLYSTVATEKKDSQSVPEVSAFDILGQLSEKLPFEVVVDLDRFDIDLDRRKLTLSGKTTSGGDVERIVEAIQATDCFKGRVTKDSVTKTNDDRTKFTLTATATCL